jgi:hypothetical protein
LTQTGGSLLIGAAIPNGASTAGALNVYTGSSLSMPSAASSSTFIVAGSGTVNLYGATLSMNVARVSALEINGTLNSYGGGPPLPVADTI